ncbi:MAG: ABC transporter substrate-binding protein [Deltaproteobacteria bacterium]|nr:ABC transporter substrate-binding protein [Deltaproteobacteria bacterium]
MVLVSFVLLFLAQFLAVLCPSYALASPQKIVIAFADFSERSGLLFVAKDQRFFEEQGLDAQIVQVRSGPIALSALASADAQYYSAPASGATLGAVAGGLDLVFVAGVINKLDGYFVVNSKIKTPADLKGKVLGVQSIGGGIWMFTMMALDHWGLNPERDKIQFRVIGDQSVIAQAMTTGIIDGSLLGFTFARMVERHGYRLLADLPKANVPYQHQGLLARKSFVDASPETTEKTLRALTKAVTFIQEPANKQAVLPTLGKWLRLPKLQGAEDLYDRMKILYERRLAPTREGLQNAIRVLGKVNPKIGGLKVEDLVDERAVRRLEQQGSF